MADLSITQLDRETSPSPTDLLLMDKLDVTARTSDGVIDAGSLDTLTSASGAFTLADDAAIVIVSGAGVAGVDLVTEVVYVSPNELTLVTVASTAVTDVDVLFPLTRGIAFKDLGSPVTYLQDEDAAVWGPFSNPFGRPVGTYITDGNDEPQTCKVVYNDDFSTIEIHSNPAFSGKVWLLP